MSFLITSQDYIASANDCEQVSCDVCGHQYKIWCRKSDSKKAQEIINNITAIVEDVNNKNKVLSFDRVLFMSLIEAMASSMQKVDSEEANHCNCFNAVDKNRRECKTLSDNYKGNCDDDSQYNLLIAEKEKEIKELEKLVQKNSKQKLSILEELEKLKSKLLDSYNQISGSAKD